MKKLAIIIALFVIGCSAASAQEKLRAEDSYAVQDCIKTKETKSEGAESCIGIVAIKCLDTPGGQSTAGQAGCYRREQLVWDDILNETYRRLQQSFDGKLKTGLRDVQRAWIESRKLQCAFYHDVIQGSLAIPTGASCFNTETARRALYLLSLLNI